MQQRILIVDDREDVRDLLVDLLDTDGRILYQASNGEEAIEILTQQDEDGDPIHLVILDLEMPVTDGWETLQVIRDVDNWPTLPVIILTVRDEPENALKAWGLEANWYITKPFSTASLCEITAQALSGQQSAESL